MKVNASTKPHPLSGLATAAILSALLVGCSGACGAPSTLGVVTSPTPTPAVVTSPTPDFVTRNYVALVHNYWIREQAADQVSNGSNVAARVCLGKDPPSAPNNMQLVDPSLCRERAVAILTNQQKFLTDLESTPPPPQFAADDQAFRTQLPKVIADLKALISAAKTGNNEAILNTANAYNNDMFPSVTDALNDVDSSVVHP